MVIGVDGGGWWLGMVVGGDGGGWWLGMVIGVDGGGVVVRNGWWW